jgi:hypothetical protein
MGAIGHARRAREAVRRQTQRAWGQAMGRAGGARGASPAGKRAQKRNRRSSMGPMHVDVRGLASRGTVRWICIHRTSGRQHSPKGASEACRSRRPGVVRHSRLVLLHCACCVLSHDTTKLPASYLWHSISIGSRHACRTRSPHVHIWPAGS